MMSHASTQQQSLGNLLYQEITERTTNTAPVAPRASEDSSTRAQSTQFPDRNPPDRNLALADSTATATHPPSAAGNTEQSSAPPSRQDCQPLFSAWGLEFGALIISLAATVSAAVVLSLYDGKPLDEWGSSTISLNTVISALGVVSKATLAFAVSGAIGQHKWNWFRMRQDGLGVFEKFDEASRGPWGSASLLWWSRATNWASLGAFVTIIALLVDPSLQATVSLRGQKDVTSSAGTLQVANYVSLGRIRPDDVTNILPFPDGREMDPSTTLPDFRLTGAFFDGLSDPSSGNTRFECGTGNCTWPLYTTAAFCSRCNDVSKLSIKQSGKASYYNATDYYTEYQTSSGGWSYTNYTLSYGHIMHFNRKNDGSNSPDRMSVLLTAFMNRDYSTSVSFRDLNTTVATLLIMRAGDGYQHENVSWEDSPPTATECGLYICAKAYQASANNGVLSETEIGTWAIRERRSWRAADHQKHGYQPTHQAWESYDERSPSFADHSVFRTDLQIVIPGSELSQSAGAEVQRKFNVTQATIRGLQAVMSSIFQVSGDAVKAYQSYDRPVKGFLVYPNNNPYFDNDVPDILYNSTNLTATFANVASRLTVQLRDSSDAVHSGLEEKFILHIQVEWSFFVLLILTLVLGSVYFVGILIQTHRLGLPAWKESTYPVLAYGFNEQTQSRLRVAEQAAYRSRAAKRDRYGMRVALLDAEGGYRLIAGESKP